jgi:mono/diheme cytochrome c family protein
MSTHSTRLVVKTVAATLAVLALGAAVVGAIVLEGGYYHIGATKQHFQIVHTLLEKGMHQSVLRHAREVTPPAGFEQPTPQLLRRGAGLYRDHCVACHGAPGVAPSDIGKSMQPVPGPLVDAARHWSPRELYWITRHGIKMSGMPAWEYRLSDADLWAVAGFVGKLPQLSPPAYAALAEEAGAQAPAAMPSRIDADARRGQRALTQYACQACHLIPGVTGPETYVGPPLKDLAGRKFIAGSLPNNADNLARWIRDPASVHPLTAMPKMNVTESDARDMAAYLLTPGVSADIRTRAEP